MAFRLTDEEYRMVAMVPSRSMRPLDFLLVSPAPNSWKQCLQRVAAVGTMAPQEGQVFLLTVVLVSPMGQHVAK